MLMREFMILFKRSESYFRDRFMVINVVAKIPMLSGDLKWILIMDCIFDTFDEAIRQWQGNG